MRQRDIFRFWLPLFASWLLMTSEGPIVSAAINRLPDEVIMLAAQGFVISLSVFIESPIINLLATATALVRDHASYRVVRRFTIHWMLLLTLVTIIIAFTPAFDIVVVGWLNAPPDVAPWVRDGLQIMTLWSAAIAWRRFQQGVLIAHDQTRQVAWGTVWRLVATAGTIILLATLTAWPGVHVAASALIAGVIVEALYATWAVRPLLRGPLAPEAPAAEPLSYRALFWFHLPLAGTSVLILLVQPLIQASLARLANPTRSLAAWPVIFQLTLVMRSAALALPEAVIALSKGAESYAPLRRFSIGVATAVTAVMALIVLTPAGSYYLGVVQDMAPAVAALAGDALPFFLLFPGLTALVFWLRGVLIHRRRTTAVNAGMAVNLLITIIALAAGIAARWPGLVTAALALNAALVVEFAFLLLRVRRTHAVDPASALASAVGDR